MLIGRLWRRAPAWRACLVTAMATTALAAMFPPFALHWPHRASTVAAPVAGAHFTPQPDPAPPGNGMFTVLPLGPARTVLVALAGRQLALPPGNWQELGLARSGGSVLVQVLVLARTEAGAITGLITAAAPGPLSGAAGLMVVPPICDATGSIAGNVTDEPADAPLRHECWTASNVDMAGPAARASTDDVLHASFRRLDRLGISVPPSMLRLRYFRSAENGWMVDEIFLPKPLRVLDGRSSPLSWATQFVARLRQGFDGALDQKPPTGLLAHDPA